MNQNKHRLLFVVTEDWLFCLHRLDLARAAREDGFEVLVATHVGEHGDLILAEDFRLLPVPFVRGIGHPYKDLLVLRHLYRIYRREQPDIVHHVALKAVLYGSLVARLAGIPAVVNTFTGLGSLYSGTTLRRRSLRTLAECTLRWSLNVPASRVIFQNAEDRDQLTRTGVVQPSLCKIIRGSGVDPSKFIPCPEPDGPPVVLLAARMLWEKGVGEFVQAARILKARGSVAQCVLAGMVDLQNPMGIPEKQLHEWDRESVVRYWGFWADMPSLLARAHIVVLPTCYGEGLPKVLLEAACCAKPLVATDHRGCREIVRPGKNGFLVPSKDPVALADAIEALVRDPSLRARMGWRGREIALKEFSKDQVSRETLEVYRELLSWPFPSGNPYSQRSRTPHYF